MNDFLLFMFFSTIEGVAVYCAALYTFRFDFKRYFWHSILIIELINFQNHLTRIYNVDDSAAAVAPIINLVITMLFFKTIVRVPLIWSIFMTLVGFGIFMSIQTGLVYAIFHSFSNLDSKETNGYILQFATGLVLIPCSRYLYKKGFGFTFDFEKLRFSGETILVILMIISFIAGLVFMMMYQNLFVNLIGFLAGSLLFLYYSIRRENVHGI